MSDEQSPRFNTIQELREWLWREFPWTQFVTEDELDRLVADLYATRTRL